MRPRRARTGLALLLLLAACQGRGLQNPVRLTLVNRSGQVVTGVLLRFDGEVARVDRVSRGGFEEIRLRLAPANTVRMEGGELDAAEAVTYEMIGVEAPPRLVEGRWLVDGAFGPRLTEQEWRER